MVNTLKHVGVKGMRWGVRKQESPASNLGSNRELVLKKGSEVSHITVEQQLKLKAKHPLYISFTEKDKALYKGSYAQDLMFMNETKKVMELKLSAKTDLIVPSKKKAVDEFIALHKDDKDVLTTMGSDRIKANTFLAVAKYIGFDSTKANTNHYRKLVESKNPKDQEKAFEDFVTFAAFSDKMRKQYFNRLSKDGFNSIYDYNDMRGGFADKPLIIFDSGKTLKIKGSSMLDEDTSQKFLKDYKDITGIDMGIGATQ